MFQYNSMAYSHCLTYMFCYMFKLKNKVYTGCFIIPINMLHFQNNKNQLKLLLLQRFYLVIKIRQRPKCLMLPGILL